MQYNINKFIFYIPTSPKKELEDLKTIKWLYNYFSSSVNKNSVSGRQLAILFRMYNNIIFKMYLSNNIIELKDADGESLIKLTYFLALEFLGIKMSDNIVSFNIKDSFSLKNAFPLENKSNQCIINCDLSCEKIRKCEFIYSSYYSRLLSDSLLDDFSITKKDNTKKDNTKKYFPFLLLLLLYFPFRKDSHITKLSATSPEIVNVLNEKMSEIKNVYYGDKELLMKIRKTLALKKYDIRLIAEFDVLNYVYPTFFSFEPTLDGQINILNKNIFSSRLNELRKINNYTQNHLAFMLNRSKKLIIFWENPNDYTKINSYDLKNLSKLLGCTPDYLLGNVNNINEILKNGLIYTKPIKYISKKDVEIELLIDTIKLQSQNLTLQKISSIKKYIDEIIKQ